MAGFAGDGFVWRVQAQQSHEVWSVAFGAEVGVGWMDGEKTRGLTCPQSNIEDEMVGCSRSSGRRRSRNISLHVYESMIDTLKLAYIT